MNVLMLMIWSMCNGIISNLPAASVIVVGLSEISPSRYNCEGFFRRMISGMPDLDKEYHMKIGINQEATLK